MRDFLNQKICEAILPPSTANTVKTTIQGFLGHKNTDLSNKGHSCGKIAQSWIGGKWYCQSCLTDVLNKTVVPRAPVIEKKVFDNLGKPALSDRVQTIPKWKPPTVNTYFDNKNQPCKGFFQGKEYKNES